MVDTEAFARARRLAAGALVVSLIGVSPTAAVAHGDTGTITSGGVSLVTADASATGAPSFVTVGAASLALAGTDKLRLEDDLVRYTRHRSQTATPTNMWGAEVVVENGVVTRILDRQITGGGATTIPEGGYVLSGHRAARSWLLANARVGAPVALGYGAVPPTELVPVGAAATSPTNLVSDDELASTVLVDGSERSVDGVDVARGIGDLVVYTPVFDTVPANRWGIEAEVVDGVVTAIHDRAIAGTAVTPPVPVVPRDGYVLSGHGASRTWLRDTLRVGDRVQLTGAARGAVGSQGSVGSLGLAAPAVSDEQALPDRVTAAYVNFRQGPRAADLPDYNVLIAAFATSRDGRTMQLESPRFDTEASLAAAIADDHARGARWLVSVGGGVERERQTFIRTTADADHVFATLTPIIDRYGFRGVDYNLENGPDGFTGDALLHLSTRLKERYGSSFAITMTPRPYENFVIDIAARHERAGLLDALQLQFYDVPEAADASFLRHWMAERTAAAVTAGVPMEKIVAGAIADPSYERGGNSARAYGDIIADLVAARGLKGGFVWDAARERDLGYPFLRDLQAR